MRGSGDLYQRSVRDLLPVVEMVASEPASTKAVRQMRSPRSADFDMLRVVRPYIGLGAGL